MIRNLTKNVVITSDYEVCSTHTQKMRGLMFSKKKNLLFIFDKQSRVSLHMFFVFFKIDVIFLDKSLNVVDIKKNFLPFTPLYLSKPCKYVIELTSGMMDTEIGDQFLITKINPA